MRLLALLVISLLIGCTTPVKPIIAQEVKLNEANYSICEPIPYTEISSLEEILLENLELYKMYAICAKKQADSVTLLKKFSNVQEAQK